MGGMRINGSRGVAAARFTMLRIVMIACYLAAEASAFSGIRVAFCLLLLAYYTDEQVACLT